VEDGRRHLVLRAPLALPHPVRLLHGTRDLDVPWETSMRLAEAIQGRDVTLTLVKDGEHRLSEPHELALLGAAVASLL
jgi:dipeptidyl aminopeptidase/acylaminoacyl peptidase